MELFLLQATIYLAAAVVAVPVARKLGLGSVLGYLMAGVIIGPLLGLVGSETRDLQHFAEFGVVMMLFIVGLELEPKALWDMRLRLIGLGGMQIFLTTAVITWAGTLLGQPLSVGLAVGLTFALSSTAIVVQTLNEKHLMSTAGGRSAFSVLLSQDIAVIPMLALIPLLALPGLHNEESHGADHGASLSLVEGLPNWGVTLMTIAAVAFVILIGRSASRPVFRYIAHSRMQEMFTAITLLLVVGIALLMTLVGLSAALGTFLAGVVLANSEYRHQLKADIDPFKGLLLGLFFITVGAGIDFGLLFHEFFTIIGLTLGVMLIKGAVLYCLTLVFKLHARDKWLFTLSLAQAGEFGFVMLGTTVQNNVIPAHMADMLLLVIALSMMLTPLLFILYERIQLRMAAEAPDRAQDDIDEQGTVIIVGIGRFGQVVNRMALATGLKTVVIDHHIDQIDQMREFGVKGFFGDPTRPELLQAAGLKDAQVLIVAVDDPKAAVKLVKYARRERPDLHIVARAFDRTHVYDLYQAGATDIVRETFDSAVRASRYLLHGMGWSRFEADKAATEFVRSDRQALRELAELWDSNVPMLQNTAYVERARQINADFHTGFLANLSQIVEDGPPGDESEGAELRKSKSALKPKAEPKTEPKADPQP